MLLREAIAVCCEIHKKHEIPSNLQEGETSQQRLWKGRNNDSPIGYSGRAALRREQCGALLGYGSVNIPTTHVTNNRAEEVFPMWSAPRLFARRLSGNTPLQQYETCCLCDPARGYILRTCL
jgi:hypothetical protein